MLRKYLKDQNGMNFERFAASNQSKKYISMRLLQGIPEKEYFRYFKGREKAVAYKLEHVIHYSTPKKLQDFNFRTPPQSFYYIRNI